MYASDWGYAIEGFSGVLGSSGSYSNENWLFKDALELTMSAYSSSNVLSSVYTGDLGNYSASRGCSSRPVLYLKFNVYVTGGTGTKADPYRLGM